MPIEWWIICGVVSVIVYLAVIIGNKWLEEMGMYSSGRHDSNRDTAHTQWPDKKAE